MRTKAKKILSVWLVFAMVLAFSTGVSAPAFAVDDLRSVAQAHAAGLDTSFKNLQDVSLKASSQVMGHGGEAASSTMSMSPSAVSVCKIGATPYSSIDAAVTAAPDNIQTTITLLQNVTAPSQVILNKNIIFALGAYSLTFSSSTANALEIDDSIVTYTGTGSLTAKTSAPISGGLYWAGVAVFGGSCTLTSASATTGEAFAVGAASSSLTGKTSTVTVKGAITSTGANAHGVHATGGSKVTVNGKITVTGEAIYASDPGTIVSAKGGVSTTGSTYIAIGGEYGAVVSVTGSVSAPNTAVIESDYPGTKIAVSGNVSTSANAKAIDAYQGVVTVGGNVTSSNANGCAVWASQSGASVSVGGSVVSGYDALFAFSGAKVSVKGNVTVTSSGGSGAWGAGGVVTIGGNISAKYTGAWVYTDTTSGYVTINGAISGVSDPSRYVIVEDSSGSPVRRSASQYLATTTKAGYRTYRSTSKSTVWVKISVPVVTRMGGADRYATAVLIAKKGWPTGASTVLLASGANYPDALAATPLATMKNAPILLTTVSSVPKVTMDEIKVLKPKSIILLGGTGVISAAQATALKNAGYSVTRYGGANRYATAQLISNAVEALGGSKTAVLVTGVNYPDALVMGPVAGMYKMPIIFSTASGLPTETKTFIAKNKITKIITVGYTAGNATIMSQAKSAVGAANVTAITGTNGYTTSVAVANKYKASFANGVAVATGANFPDALTGGALAAKMKFPILLINPTSGASAGAKAYVKTLGSPAIYVFGGTGVLKDAIVKSLYQ